MAPVLGRGRWDRAAVLVVALVAVASQALVTPLVSADRGPASAAPTASQGTWPAGLREAADAAIAADAYRFAPGTDGTWVTTTPAQGLRSSFGPTGPTVADTIRGGALSLDLARLGRPGALAPVEAAEVVGTANGVEYRRGPSLVEWYRNEARGLEQGFTLASAPSSGPGPLILEMDATGLAVALSTDGSAVVASAPDAGAVLRYSGLEVLDAAGRRLPAWLAVEGQVVQLRIDDDGAAYPLDIDPWFQQAKLTASDAAGGDRFGVSVAVSGDTAVVGANAADTPASSNAGSAYVFVRSAGTWTLQAKLAAADAAAADNFGISVAVSGDTAVVGAYLDDTPAGSNAGSAYVFVRSAGTWAQQQKLTASDAAPSDFFGISVAVSGDTAVVGAYLDDTPAGIDSGSASVFVRSAGTWAQQQKLTASDAAANDSFGVSVTVSGDTAVVGAYLDDTPAGTNAGSAFVFVRSAGTWAQQQKLTASDTAAVDNFGMSVAVSGDTAVVGAPFDDIAAGTDAGSAYVFVRSAGTWAQQQKLTASDAAANDNFGASVAVSGDTAVVGAYFDDAPAGSDAGSAYVFRLSEASPTISTQASPGGPLGTPVTDTATLAGGANPTGDVTFRLFSDANCTAQVFTSTNGLSGGTATSGSFTPASAGAYRWTAVYNGDANNNTATSPCNAPNESVVITPFQAPAFTRTLTEDVVGPVTVNSGESVLITGAWVAGPVTVNPGGALTVVNSKFSRTVTATAPSFFSMCGTEVSGPPPATALSVTGAQVPIRVGDPATDCAGNRFAGPVVLSSNLAVTFGANAVSHNATLDNNGPGNTVVKANTLFGTLGCTGNNPPPTNAGQVNTAGAKTGQCAGL